jgi:hypothetical protein
MAASSMPIKRASSSLPIMSVLVFHSNSISAHRLTLETILVTFVPVWSNKMLPLAVFPDTGAHVTTIPASAVDGVALELTKIIPRRADGNTLNIKDAFEARVCLKDNDTFKTIFVVSGLSCLLLSRITMKELDLIHRDFPFQDIATVNAVQSSSKTRMAICANHSSHARPDQVYASHH